MSAQAYVVCVCVEREREELLQNVNNWWTYIKDIWLFPALFYRLEILKIKNWEHICLFLNLVSFIFAFYLYSLFSPVTGFLYFSGNSAFTNWPPLELFRELHNIAKSRTRLSDCTELNWHNIQKRAPE